MRFFAYGTLKSTHSRGNTLEYSLGMLRVSLPYKMVSLGPFPGLVPDENYHQITGELFDISTEELDILDMIEGYPDFYTRKQEIILDAPTWIYYLPPEEYGEYPEVCNGNWS